jgi:predicted RNA-binding Zn-ribbon protein involved in translation (DUF1610 family)
MMWEAILILMAGLILATLILWFLFKFWPVTGKMGINLDKVDCPECGDTVPVIRKPENIRRALWGGWTCKKCGTEMNKYGHKIHS